MASRLRRTLHISVLNSSYKNAFSILVVLILWLSNFTPASAQTKTQSKILAALSTQTAAWNRGDIDGFMQTYWQHDSLMFIGKSGATYGWQNTLKNYKKSYPDKTALGFLTFNILKVQKLSAKYYNIIGRWHIGRNIGNLSGHFTLLFKKINGKWLIVQDHSS